MTPSLLKSLFLEKRLVH